MTSPRRRGGIVITGGGTAGHVLPAIAIARALVDGGRPAEELLYVGSRRGLEARLVKEAGLQAVLLGGRGIERRLSRASVTAAASLVLACVEALVLLAKRRPDAVVSVGGYAGLPSALGAIALRIPLVVVNVDAVPGAANRITGRLAAACAVALEGTGLPRAVLTGAPVRPEALAVDRSDAGRAKARAALGLPMDGLVVAVTGGSLGARRLNDAALALARRWSDCGDLVLYQVTGERDHAAVLQELAVAPAGERRLDHRVVAYESRLPELFAAADLVVARAGASTISELTVIGTPSVLVPLPGAPGDHQRRNAERLAAAGAALLVPNEEATGDRLGPLVEELLAQPGRREEMAAAAAALGRPDAAAKVAALVESFAEPAGGRR